MFQRSKNLGKTSWASDRKNGPVDILPVEDVMGFEKPKWAFLQAQPGGTGAGSFRWFDPWSLQDSCVVWTRCFISILSSICLSLVSNRLCQQPPKWFHSEQDTGWCSTLGPLWSVLFGFKDTWYIAPLDLRIMLCSVAGLFRCALGHSWQWASLLFRRDSAEEFIWRKHSPANREFRNN